MTETQLFDIEKILTLDIPEYIIEDVHVRDLNGGIKKKFTSLSKSPVTYTKIYDPTIFRWKFGDETDPDIYTETAERVIHHTYAKPGIYLVQHQACNFCTCSGWNLCFKEVAVEAPVPTNIVPALVTAGFFGLVLLPKRKCEDYDTKKKCEKKPKECQWMDERKKCIKKGKTVPVPPTKIHIKEDEFLISKLKEKGAKGIPLCKDGVCRIGKWVAIYQKGKDPIIIHDP